MLKLIDYKIILLLIFAVTVANSSQLNQHIKLGKYAAEFHDYDRAAQHYEDALKKSPKSKSVLFILSALYQKSGDYAKAEKILKKLLVYYPLDSDAHLCLGNIYLAQNRINIAVKEFQQATDLNRDNAAAYRNLGYAQLIGGASYTAIQSLKKSIELNPTNALTYFDLGLAYHNSGDIKLAVKSFHNGFKLKNTTEGKSLYTMVIEKSAEKEMNAAISEYKRNKEIQLCV